MIHDETPVPLPSAALIQLSPDVILQPPLSRRGYGPGLIILASRDVSLEKGPNSLDPPPLQKWAEEGYAVVQITSVEAASKFAKDWEAAIEALSALPECIPNDKIGIICWF